MTFDIGLVLGILIVSFVLFVTEWIRMDVTALLVLGVLAVSGLLEPNEALSGFSNPAVVTVWAMFMISAGLTQTGVANAIGRQVLRLAGTGEIRLVAVIMLTSGVLSSFMANIGVAALMLPVVMDVARRTERPPSRLLMPLAFGCLLGGLTTLIGTPPNLLVKRVVEGEWCQEGVRTVRLHATGRYRWRSAGIAFLALVGRKLAARKQGGAGSLVGRRPTQRPGASTALQETTRSRSCIMRVGSPLIGRTVCGHSRLGSAAGAQPASAISRDRGGYLSRPRSVTTVLHEPTTGC